MNTPRFPLPLLLLGLLSTLAHAQGYRPDEAVRRMTTPEGLEVKLVAAEPDVRQPVAIEFDDRGRLWVIQYLQYPNPAGLKRVKVDRFSRTIYDRVPEPPPRGPKGADRITILDGQKAKDFVSDLNLATGLAFGHGGVFVLQVPYLLFYPDRDGDDIPDGDPDVLVTGFGMDDAHSVANSLTWGPDGWLYGCQGSTVTANIKGIEFQQGVWRYHPLTRRFELFCEGGGNSWGLDFDRHGNLLYSTNVGGFTMLHGVQGGYYWKSFGKHGALHNPFAYGYIDHVPHSNFKGGHVTVGGVFYGGDTFPERYRGKLIAGDLLGHNVYWHEVEPNGSSFRSKHGGDLLFSNDTWFAPTDVTIGPDGSVYVSDWSDRRTAHPDPDAEWDRTNGRIYKIEAKGTKAALIPDWKKMPSDRLVSMLSHPNQWYVRRARRVLADRRDPEVILPLRSLITETKDDQLALEALWALYVSGGLSERFAEALLEHRNPNVRRWTVRLLGDDNRVSAAVGKKLITLAETEPDVTVRSQLASTAKRLPARDGLAIVERLLLRDKDAADPHLPLLLWWAVERHSLEAMPSVVESFASPAMWKSSLARNTILPRLVRRYTAAGTEDAANAAVRLLSSAPNAGERNRLVAAIDQGLQERQGKAERAGAVLIQHLGPLWKAESENLSLLQPLVRLQHGPALDQALRTAADARASAGTRSALLRLLGDVGSATCIEPAVKLLGTAEPETVQIAALDAVSRFDRADVADSLLAAYPKLSPRLRSRTVEVLLGRKRSAAKLLQLVDTGKLAAKDIAVDQLRVVASHHDEKLDALVRKHWGNVGVGTPEEKLAEVRRLNNDLRAGPGSATRGKPLFTKHCAICHKLFGEGGMVGPDLTHANRKDRDYLLVSMVDPSAVIRKEYLSATVQTKDGRSLTGLIVEQTPARITLVAANGDKTTLARERIESIEDSPVSLMPENLLKELKPEELRDLFAYLQSDSPK